VDFFVGMDLVQDFEGSIGKCFYLLQLNSKILRIERIVLILFVISDFY
jgi:hypothetical protein